MNKNKKIVWILIVIFVFQTLLPIMGELQIINKSHAITTINSSENKIITSNTKTDGYSKLYEQYLNLSEEEKNNLAVIPRKYDIPMDVLYEKNEIKKKSGFLNLFQNDDAQEIPESYILLQDEDTDIECEKYGGIDIQVEDQGPYGLCWDFASLTTLETYLALKGLDYDFSERHLDYLTSEEFGGERTFEDGGGFGFFERYCINNYGPVLEEDVPYDKKYSAEEYDYLLELNPVIYVDGTIAFPTIYKNETITYTEEELTLFRNKVKKHIIQNGALFATICSSEDGTDGWFSGQEIIKPYNGKYVLNYNGSHFINHAITIIGWDDNFSTENFPEECRPNSNGAYIALNSWGNDWGNNGIFYISYEDIYVESNMCGVTSVTTKENICEIVNFEDENLYNAIKNVLGSEITQYDDENKNLYVNKNLIQNVINLDISNKGIENLVGLEKFGNISKLNLSNNSISNIDILQNLTNLTELNLSNNNISDINSLQNLTNLTELDLSNNIISDISSLPDAQYTKLVLSSNPIEIFPNCSINSAETYFDNCNLENDDVLKIYEMIPNYLVLSLKNNNITDLSCINYDYYERKRMNLSGNRNIDLSTIPNVGELILSDCNITNVEKIAEKFLGNSLNLSNNQIEDIRPLQVLDLYKLNISYTNLKDISCLTNIKYLDVSGNEEIIGLNGLTNLTSLEINDCNLNNTTLNNSIENLTSLELLSINNNSITNIDFVNDYPFLNTLYANNNQLESINNIYNTNIKNLYLSHNNISDLSGLSNFNYFTNLNLSHNNILDLSYLSNIGGIEKLDLSYNDIEDISPLESIRFGYEYIVSNNKIKDIEEKFVIAKNLEISLKLDIEKDKLNTIILPKILNNAFKNGMYEDNVQFICENCTINPTATKLKLESNMLGEGQAKVTIKGGRFDGTTYTINYNTVDKINVTDIKIINEATKKRYIENENFDETGLVVQVTYENGLIENTTDYTLINNENLIPGQEGVTIKSGKNPEIEIIHPIKVYAEAEVLSIYFPDTNLYNSIKSTYALQNNIKDVRQNLVLKYDDNSNIIIMVKEKLDQVEHLYLERQDIRNISGVENFTNLTNINLDYNENLESINELLLLNNIKYIRIVNTNIKDIKDFINEENITSIGLGRIYENFTDTIITEVELPNTIYQALTLQEGVSAEAYIYYDVELMDDGYYNIKDSNNNKKTEVKIDTENKKAILELDKQITNETKKGIRCIQVAIQGGKTSGTYYTVAYNVDVELQKIEITTLPTKQSYSEGDNFDKAGMVVTATYNDGTTKEVTNYEITDGNNLTAGKTSVTISYTENGVTKEVAQGITVNEDHTWNTGEVTKEPTCKDKGEKIYTCTVCNKTKIQEIAETGHKYENGVCVNCGENIFTEESKYYIILSELMGISPNTTIGKFITNIMEKYTVKIMKDNQEVTEGKIATGMQIKIFEKEQEVDSCTAVVTGDTDGNGNADIRDMIKINNYRLYGTTTNFEGAYQTAGDVNRDGKIDIKDMIRINNYRLYNTSI